MRDGLALFIGDREKIDRALTRNAGYKKAASRTTASTQPSFPVKPPLLLPRELDWQLDEWGAAWPAKIGADPLPVSHVTERNSHQFVRNWHCQRLGSTPA